MSVSTLTIGKLAASAGVGVETVRFYERKGLIEQPPRPPRGFRSYSEEALRQLNFIRQARGLGFGLEEIRGLLTFRDDPEATQRDVRKQTSQKIDEIDRRLAALEEMKTALEGLLESCTGDGPAANCPILDALEVP